jgi:phage shock protein A
MYEYQLEKLNELNNRIKEAEDEFEKIKNLYYEERPDSSHEFEQTTHLTVAGMYVDDELARIIYDYYKNRLDNLKNEFSKIKVDFGEGN